MGVRDVKTDDGRDGARGDRDQTWDLVAGVTRRRRRIRRFGKREVSVPPKDLILIPV